jgi:hypothetical protein
LFFGGKAENNFGFLISGSKEVGDKLKAMLKIGAGKPWKDVMEVMTDQRDMSTSAFREYFKPLEDWLIKENAKNNVKVGWKVPPIEEMCKTSKHSGASSNIVPTTVFYIILGTFFVIRY